MPGNAILSGFEREHKEERNKAWNKGTVSKIVGKAST